MSYVSCVCSNMARITVSALKAGGLTDLLQQESSKNKEEMVREMLLDEKLRERKKSISVSRKLSQFNSIDQVPYPLSASASIFRSLLPCSLRYFSLCLLPCLSLFLCLLFLSLLPLVCSPLMPSLLFASPMRSKAAVRP